VTLVFLAAAGKHAPDNVSDEPLELILVELKGYSVRN
jgi:hypothetical protein